MATNTYSPGSSVWQELIVPALDGIADFYERVLGWELVAQEDRGVFLLGGTPVAGVRVDTAATSGEWVVYLGVDALEAAVARAVGAGATVITASQAVSLPGASAVDLEDPAGARFGLIDATDSPVSVPSVSSGRLALVDPMYHDLALGTAFHRALFPENDLTHEEVNMSIFRDAEGTALRGLNDIEPELRDVLPSHWLPWFAVTSQTTAVDTAPEAGGGTNTRDNDFKFGIWGVVRDPQGGTFKTLEVHVPAL